MNEPSSAQKHLIFLLDLSISEGCTVIVDAVFEWATILVDPNSTFVPDDVITYISPVIHRLHPTIQKQEWNPREYWEQLILEFHRRMMDLALNFKIGEPQQRATSSKKGIIKEELKERSHILANRMEEVSIGEALDFIEKLVFDWATRHDIEELRRNAPMHLVNSSEEDLSSIIPYFLAQETEY